eukprot:6701239-Prymnesium_polylepis.1
MASDAASWTLERRAGPCVAGVTYHECTLDHAKAHTGSHQHPWCLLHNGPRLEGCGSHSHSVKGNVYWYDECIATPPHPPSPPRTTPYPIRPPSPP